MTIAELRERSNRAISRVPKDLLLVLVVVLVATASFGLGILAGRDEGVGNKGFWIEEGAAVTATSAPAAAIAAPLPSASTQVADASPGAAVGQYVASKNGTKYYLPSCSGASRIKEANRVWFASKEEAEASGRTPASNCPGL